jgi:hypothetical protein
MISPRVAIPKRVVHVVTQCRYGAKVIGPPLRAGPPWQTGPLLGIFNFLRTCHEVEDVHASLASLDSLEHFLMGIVIEHETKIDRLRVHKQNGYP